VNNMNYMFAFTKKFNQSIRDWTFNPNNFLCCMFHEAEMFNISDNLLEKIDKNMIKQEIVSNEFLLNDRKMVLNLLINKINHSNHEKKKDIENYLNLFINNVLKFIPNKFDIPNENIENHNNSLANVKKVEDERVCWIVEQINNRTEYGLKLINAYYCAFNKKIIKAEKKGSNRDHFDIVLIHEDNTISKCEEKGSSLSLKITDNGNAWENSVQLFNSSAANFDVCKKWSHLWYSMLIDEREYWKEIGIKQEVPVYDEWIKDAFRCGDPKTEFVKELKQVWRNKFNKKSSMNGKKGGQDFREKVNSKFIMNTEDKNKFIQQLNDVMDRVINSKNCFLQTSGIKGNDISFKWKKGLIKPLIVDVSSEYKFGSDLKFNVKTSNDKDFHCLLRFGKGCGFTNIRLDIK